MRKLILTVLCIYFSHSIYNAQFIQYSRVYTSTVGSIEIDNIERHFGLPIANLHTEHVRVAFDVFGTIHTQYMYEIIPCNYKWEYYTDFNVNVFFNGFNQDMVQHYEFFSSTIPYIQYSFSIPNDRIHIKKASNYIIRIYADTDTILQLRCAFFTQKTIPKTQVLEPDRIPEQQYKQAIQVSVLDPNKHLHNPFTDVKIGIIQNQDWHTVRHVKQPVFVNNNTIVYNKITFDGLNEFRLLDIRDRVPVNYHIAKVHEDDIILTPDKSRRIQQHFRESDLNGFQYIGDKDWTDNTFLASELVYHRVRFILDSKPIPEGAPVILGAFNTYFPYRHKTMEYDASRNAYTYSILLKQGVYPYMYALSNPMLQHLDIPFFEGNHSETENTYHILVYNRNRLYNFDEIVGMETINTRVR